MAERIEGSTINGVLKSDALYRARRAKDQREHSARLAKEMEDLQAGIGSAGVEKIKRKIWKDEKATRAELTLPEGLNGKERERWMHRVVRRREAYRRVVFRGVLQAIDSGVFSVEQFIGSGYLGFDESDDYMRLRGAGPSYVFGLRDHLAKLKTNDSGLDVGKEVSSEQVVQGTGFQGKDGFSREVFNGERDVIEDTATKQIVVFRGAGDFADADAEGSTD